MVLEGKKMKFLYVNENGSDIFEESDIAKAIASAKKVDADLFVLRNNIEEPLLTTIKKHNPGYQGTPVLVFDKKEDDEYNSELLKEYGVYIEDRIVKDLRTKEVKSFTENEILKLVG
jgi:hypothetical protein